MSEYASGSDAIWYFCHGRAGSDKRTNRTRASSWQAYSGSDLGAEVVYVIRQIAYQCLIPAVNGGLN